MLTKNSTIRVPVDTAGNLGGLYDELGTDPRYFRIVNMADPAFETRRIYFQLDSSYLGSFQDTVNFVSVNLRKTYPAQPAFTSSGALHGGRHQVRQDLPGGSRSLAWARRVRTGRSTRCRCAGAWRDGTTLSLPARDGEWTRQSDATVALAPPFERRVIEIEADRQLFTANGQSTAVVDIASMLGGKPRLQHRATLRATDTESVSRLVVYHDLDTPVAARVSWYSGSGTKEGKLAVLDSNYVLLAAPPAAAGGTQ